MKEEEYQKQVQAVLSKIREERQKANMSQMELSFAAGLSQNQVNCIESGRNIPNLYTLIKICDALKIRPEILFSASDEEREKVKNEIITLVKDTSLARVVMVVELICAAEKLMAKAIIWPLFYAGAFYLIFVGVLTIAFNFLEKKLSYFKV